MNVRKLAAAATVAALVAAGAWAGVTELVDRAEALQDDYEALEIEINACTDGLCAEAQDLIDALDALDAGLATLAADVTSCSCSNPTLDDLMADLDAISTSLRTVVDYWNE